MPDKKGRFTAQEKSFIEAMVRTNDKAYSATEAGYRHPTVTGSIVAAKPPIDAEIRRLSEARLQNVGVPLAIETLINIAIDVKQSGANRVNAADKILKHANAGTEGAEGKEPHEMTADELAKAIAHLNQIKADKARPIVELEASTIDPGQGLFD